MSFPIKLATKKQDDNWISFAMPHAACETWKKFGNTNQMPLT